MYVHIVMPDDRVDEVDKIDANNPYCKYKNVGIADSIMPRARENRYNDCYYRYYWDCYQGHFCLNMIKIVFMAFSGSIHCPSNISPQTMSFRQERHCADNHA